jgi:hypothetical protein
MSRRLPAIAFAVAVLWTGAAHSLTWDCVLSAAGTRLECRAEAGDDGAVAAAPAPLALVNGTRFPLDPARAYHVPLWAPPNDDAEFVLLLARATICFRSPGCRVRLAPSAWLRSAAATHAGASTHSH